VIALASALLDELGAADLDRVLAHEWAQVQRRDDIAQVAQGAIRAVVGWHPAVWWLGRQIAFEREAACDQMAVAITGSAKGYAACLAALAALPPAPGSALPMLAAGAPSRLHRRVVRILALRPGGAARAGRAVAIAGGLAVLVSAVAAGRVRVVTAEPSPMTLTAGAPPRAAVAEVRPLSPSLAAQAAESDLNPMASQKIGGSRTARQRPAGLATSSSLQSAHWPVAEVNMRPPAAGVAEVAGDAPFSAPAQPPNAPSQPPNAPAQPPNAPAQPQSAQAQPPSAPETARLESSPAVWVHAAEAGVGLARVSKVAGVATAGFFNRFGKKIADSFEAAGARPSRQSE
jgi:hypothetical protein